LEDTLHLRDTWPELAWVPRLAVFKPQVRYRLLDSFPGEGFKMYMPDTAALRGYQVMGSDATLSESSARAATLGFNTLWVHALDADERGKGLDLDLLEHARAQFDGELWLSGGATRERHLANLAIHKGAAAVVIPTALAKQYGCERLLSVLATPPTTGIPLRFVAKPTSVSKNCG
ncbi:MAG: HisA/HisF-related TIM barrel protein, partial [Acidiferrobacterales bacterium]